jgi:hypothetical protein
MWDKVFCLLGQRYSLWTSVVLSVSLATLKARAFSICITASRLAKRTRLLILFARSLDLISITLVWSSVLPRFNRLDCCRGKVDHDYEIWRRVRESRNVVRLILNLGAEWGERSGLGPGSSVGKHAGAHWIGRRGGRPGIEPRFLGHSSRSLVCIYSNPFGITAEHISCNK